MGKKKQKTSFSQVAGFLWRYVKRHTRDTAIVIGFGVISSTFDMATPFIFGQVIDHFFGKRLLFGMSIYQLFIAWVAVLCADIIVNRIQNVRVDMLEARVEKDVVMDVTTHVMTLPVSYHHNQKPGELSSRISRTSSTVSNIIDSLVYNVGPNLLTISLIMIVFFTIHPLMGLFNVIIAAVFLTVVMKFHAQDIITTRKKLNRIYDSIYGRIGDYVSNIASVKIFATQEYEQRRQQRAYDKAIDTVSRHVGYWAQVGSAQMILAKVGWVGTIIFAGMLLQRQAITPGQFVMMVGYLPYVYRPLGWVANQIRMMKRWLADIDAVKKILAEKPESVDENETDISGIIGAIDFHNVSFTYPDRKDGMLKGVSFSVTPGQVLAIFGKTGSGKTTLYNLLLRMYDIQKGRILVDGADITAISRRSLRDHIAIVPQHPILFNDTLLHNIRYGKVTASDAEVQEAARQANCMEFIEKLPKKFNAKVGEKGVKLSGGQVQRIAIARAILRDPDILILDEATSSLDQETKFQVLDALDRLIKGRTTIIITHDFSSITQKADTIIVLEDGKIVQQGNHRALLKQSGMYQKLYRMYEQHLYGDADNGDDAKLAG